MEEPDSKKTQLEPFPLLRDTIIVWLICYFGGALAVYAAHGDMDKRNEYLFVASKAVPFLAFFLVGCLEPGPRMKRLALVCVLYWVAWLLVIGPTATFRSWLCALPILLVLMLLGGGLSYVVRR